LGGEQSFTWERMFSNFMTPYFSITRPWTMRPLFLKRGETIIQ